MDYYEMLGLEESASREDIKKSFLRLILQIHPDKTNEESEQAQTLIIAYKTLYDPHSREEYDSKRNKKSHFKQGYVDRSPNILNQTDDEIEVACGQCEMENRIKLSLIMAYQYYECVACNYNIFITN